MIKKILYPVLFLIFIFYYLYPAALPIFGFSFIFTGGILGISLYIYNQFPYTEVVTTLLLFGVMCLWSLFCTFTNNATDSYILYYSKSQIGWFFTAYFVVFLFNKVHPKGGFNIFAYYIIAAIILQGAIAVAMYVNPAISDFFTSIEMIDELGELKRLQTEGKRLHGYGIAFFGAGIACGFALILLVYILMSKKNSLMQILIISLAYVAIFFVGMMSARTTLVGAAASLALLFIYILRGSPYKSQISTAFFVMGILSVVGVTVLYSQFREFADWALEPLINYQEKGEFRTHSSDGLTLVLTNVLPENASQWIFGVGIGEFLGHDVGYTRLLFWFGIPGTILFFLYQYFLIKKSFTGNENLNIMLLITFAYNLALNVKGLSDLNPYWLLFMFYFLNYRYNIYTPYLYRIGKLKENTLRNAVQSSASRRRV